MSNMKQLTEGEEEGGEGEGEGEEEGGGENFLNCNTTKRLKKAWQVKNTFNSTNAKETRENCVNYCKTGI